MKILKDKFENFYLFLNNKYYREFIRLLVKYRNYERNKPESVNFLKYKIQVQDCLSFIFQVKDIFVKQYYYFNPDSINPVIYDCGANVGTSCLFFKEFYPSAKIKAFEPDPSISLLLKNNLNSNSIDDVEIISKAVWVDNNGIEFGAEGSDTGSIFSTKNQIRVESVRLKDLLEEETEVDLLKLDIEGAEVEVIEDCNESLLKVKNIFIEYHSFKDKEQDLDKILKILSQNHFRYYVNSEQKKFAPFINRNESVTPLMDLQLNIFAYRE